MRHEQQQQHESDALPRLLAALGARSLEEALRLAQERAPTPQCVSAANARAPPDVYLSFRDLKSMGLLTSWQNLHNWQHDPAVKFPRGRMIGPNTRRWSWREEIAPWVASRPSERAQPR